MCEPINKRDSISIIMQWETSQVALMPAYKNAMADQAARPSGGGGGACVENAHACLPCRRSANIMPGDRGCKPAGRRVARPGWPGAQPNDKRRRRAGQIAASISPESVRPRLDSRESGLRIQKAQFGFVLSGLAFDLPSLAWLFPP